MQPIKNIDDYFVVREYGRGNRTVFLFGGWRTKAVFYKPLVRKLAKQGFRCVLYVPKTKLIAVGTPYSEIINAAGLAAEHVRACIRQQTQDGVREFVSFGISFGTLFAAESAKQNPSIRKLVLIAPFGDMAEHIKLWPKHWYFSRVLDSQPTNHEQSGVVLNQVGLTTNLNKLNATEIFLCYSGSDTVLHTSVAEGLVTALDRANIKPKIVRVRGGHLLGILNGLAIHREWFKFLIH